MGWNDYIYGGGLFGGYGGFEDLPDPARDRANRQGLMTAGALMMRNSVGPNNMGFMGNMSSALLAGRESFESILDREAVREAMNERKRKQEELEREKIRMEEEAEEARFNAWQTKEGQRTHAVNTIIEKTGKSFDDVNNMDDSTIASVYEKIMFPPEPKSSKIKYQGRLPIEVDPEGNEIYRPDLPVLPSMREPKEPPTPDEIAEKEFRDRERFISGYIDDLSRIRDTEDKYDASGNKTGVISTARYNDPLEMRRMALDAWDKARDPFGRVEGGGSSTAGGPPPPRKSEPTRLMDSRGGEAPVAVTPREVENASTLVTRLGVEKARAAMISAGGSEREVDYLLSLVNRR